MKSSEKLDIYLNVINRRGFIKTAGLLLAFLGGLFGRVDKARAAVIKSLYDLGINVYPIEKTDIEKFIEDFESGKLSPEEAENHWNSMIRNSKDLSDKMKKGGADTRFWGKAKVKGDQVKILTSDEFFYTDPIIGGPPTKGKISIDHLIVFKNGKLHKLQAGVWINLSDIDALRSSRITAAMFLNNLSYGGDSGSGAGGEGGESGSGGSGGAGGSGSGGSF